MAQPDGPQSEPQQTTKQRILKRLFGSTSGRHNGSSSQSSPIDLPASLVSDQSEDGENPEAGDPLAGDPLKPSMSRRGRGSVVPGLPRAQTFKRRLSEDRTHLAPVQPSVDERRAVSMDRRSHHFRSRVLSADGPRDTLSDLGSHLEYQPLTLDVPSLPMPDAIEDHGLDNATSNGHSTDHATETPDTFSDAHSISDSEYEAQIRGELEKRWILNLSMHFKDHSRREKFFVTYRQDDNAWRRVTVSLDYRNAPPNSLEMDLIHTKFQRDKNQKIFEAIRESLPDIHFFDTVTNLKLETTDGRLHVHVVEDGNEIIPYPPVSQVAHLGCRRVRESEVEFHSHMSGFVYKVDVGGEILIKKEIPSPETIEEFLYEINALNSLTYSDNVINFHGVVVDEYDEFVKGLLISYADGGALIDVIYDNCKDPNGQGLAWPVRERWARQIVNGLADIHESGYVQGDFTLSNIVIDHRDDAKIIDINRRGCPVGWEPPEATPLLDSNHRISMYIGIKSDLYQLGMVLWALAMEDDEPDLERRPLALGPEAKVPEWYRVLTETCLHPDPRRRLQASQLTQMFPPEESRAEHISVDDGLSQQSYYVDECNTVRPPSDWSHYDPRFTPSGPPTYDAWNYAPRGRSPPSPLPSNPDVSESHRGVYSPTAWAARRFIRPSYSDAGADDVRPDETAHHFTPTPTADRIDFPAGELRLDEEEGDIPDEGTSADATPTEPKDKAPVDGQALGESLEVSRNLNQDDSEAGEDAADSEPLKEISHNIQKKEAQEAAADPAKASADPMPEEPPIDHGDAAQVKDDDDVLAEPTGSSKAEGAIASDEAKAPEAGDPEALDAKSKPASDEPAPNAAVDENKPTDTSLESTEADAADAREALPAEASDIDEAVGAAAATEAGLPESEAAKDIDPAPKAAEAATDSNAPPVEDPLAEATADKEEDKNDKETIADTPEVPSANEDQDDSKIEEAAAPAIAEGAATNSEAAQTEAKDASASTADAKEEVPGEKKDEDVEKKEDTNTPTQLPEQPDVQAESTLDKDAPQIDSGPSATKGPDANLDEPAEQAPGQQAVPASDDLPPGKLDASELVNGDDIQEPRSSDPPDDSSRPDDESGVKAEPTVPEMPAMAETGDQVVAAATPEVSANEDTAPKTELEAAEPAAANTEASAPDLPDALAGIGSGLPNFENSAISEQDFIHDDDFHATRRPEPLTT